MKTFCVVYDIGKHCFAVQKRSPHLPHGHGLVNKEFRDRKEANECCKRQAAKPGITNARVVTFDWR